MTDVVFLRDGTVFALFPAFTGSVDDPDVAICYQSVGQHGQAHIDYCMTCIEVTDPAEYADLKGELERIGYDDLNVVELGSIDSTDYYNLRLANCPVYREREA